MKEKIHKEITELPSSSRRDPLATTPSSRPELVPKKNESMVRNTNEKVENHKNTDQ